MRQNLKCAYLSKRAYGKDKFIIDKKYLIENKKTDTQCYVFTEGKITYIAFRGTELKLKDIFTDLWAFKKDIPFKNTKGIRVHGGFLKAYMSVRDDILSKVIELGNHRIIATGHSLGGALATLCSVDLEKNSIAHPCDIILYTYGSPKVGNRKFRKSFGKRIVYHNRYVNRFDIVPTVPVFASHTGRKIKLKPKIRHDINNYIYNVIAQ